MKTSIQTSGQAHDGESTAGVLLSPAESVQRARPLRTWGLAQREWVESCVSRLTQDWHQAWGLSTTSQRQERDDLSFALSPNEVGTLETRLGMPSGVKPVCAWFYTPNHDAPGRWQGRLHRGTITPEQSQAPCTALRDSMFGDDASHRGAMLSVDSVALELISLAWTDWWRRLEADFPPAQEHPSTATANQPWWSGSLQLQLPWCGGVFVLELTFEQITSALAKRAPKLLIPSRSNTAAAASQKNRLVNVVNALGTHALGLRAMLTGVELSLRQIQSLRVGDVVPLRHRLDEPALLETRDAFVVCQGWLGQQSGCVAVEMVSPVAPTRKD